MFLNVNENKLRAEAETFAAQHKHSSEVERLNALESIESDQRAAAGEQEEFAAFQKNQNASRAFKMFLVNYPRYVNCGENTVVMDGWIRANRNNEVTAESLQAAFEALTAAGKLLLDTTKKTHKTDLGDSLDQLSAEQLFEALQKAEEQVQAEEAEDRLAFETAGNRDGYRFLRTHPEYVTSPANQAEFQLYFNTRRLNLSQATFEQISEAYNELAAQGKLQLRAKPAKSEQVSEASLYDMGLDNLAELSGGLDTNEDTYVPDPLVRYRQQF
jgi:hypothetical protein